jgi:transcriptional regulator with XRE-family HTH domain
VYDSQEAFATAIEVAPPYVSQMETGKRVPSDELLRRMAQVLPKAADWEALRLEAHRLRSPLDLANLLDKPQSVPEIFQDPLFHRLHRELEGTPLPKESRDHLINTWLEQMKLFKDSTPAKPKRPARLARRSG